MMIFMPRLLMSWRSESSKPSKVSGGSESFSCWKSLSTVQSASVPTLFMVSSDTLALADRISCCSSSRRSSECDSSSFRSESFFSAASSLPRLSESFQRISSSFFWRETSFFMRARRWTVAIPSSDRDVLIPSISSSIRSRAASRLETIVVRDFFRISAMWIWLFRFESLAALLSSSLSSVLHSLDSSLR